MEQQAKIVEAWFAGFLSTQTTRVYYGMMDPRHPAYPYITTNVRPGLPQAVNRRT